MPIPISAVRGRAFPRADIEKMLVAYWPLNETGGTRLDTIGAHDATLFADAVGSAAGKIGNAADFELDNTDGLQVAYAVDIATGDVPFTIACWVKLETKAVSMDIISRWSATTATGDEFIIGYLQSSDRFRFVVRNAADDATVSVLANNLGAVSTGTWYFIVAWHDPAANTINIQVNNGTADSQALVGGVHATELLMGIGLRIDADAPGGSNNYFDGLIDEVGFWRRVLTAAERTLLYNSGSGLTYPVSITNYLDYDGCWSWFTNPRAVYHNGKTYWCAIDGAGDLNVYSYTHSGGATSLELVNAFQGDDHSNGALLIRDADKKVLVFATRHNDTACSYWLSTNAEDASEFGAVVNIDASLGGDKYDYPCPIQLTGETNDPIYLFYRHATTELAWDGSYFSVSSDGGATWSAGTQFFKNGAERPYFQYASNGTTRIDFACTQGHPAAVAGCSIYHFYYEAGHWYKSDGTDLGTSAAALPLEPADVTRVYDGSSVEAWVWDIAIDSNGYPVIVYATFPTPASDHRYRYARWTGSAWDDHEICTAGGPLYAGETYYSGGVTLDKSDPSIVWCSRKIGSQFEIWKYITNDGGTTWIGSSITANSSVVNGRPYCAVGAPANSEPIWWRGTYTAYDNFSTQVRFRP